jgi:hypothetical protein
MLYLRGFGSLESTLALVLRGLEFKKVLIPQLLKEDGLYEELSEVGLGFRLQNRRAENFRLHNYLNISGIIEF